MNNPFTSSKHDILDETAPIIFDTWNPIAVDFNKLSKFIKITINMIEKF
jgi:hypothetical protein